MLMVRMCCNIWQKTSYRSAHLQPHRNLHKLQSMFDTIMILATKSCCFFSGGTENSFCRLSSSPQQNPAKSCVPSLNSLNSPSPHNLTSRTTNSAHWTHTKSICSSQHPSASHRQLQSVSYMRHSSINTCSVFQRSLRHWVHCDNRCVNDKGHVL